MRAGTSLSLIALATLSWAQSPKTLETFLREHPSPNTLVVSPETTKTSGQGGTLADLKRKASKVGGISAIVPINTLQFDDSLLQAPNLYDGLPRTAKVHYLMSTLSAEQWRTASRVGLGLANLTPEQRPVFLSILPKVVKWTKHKVGADHQFGPKTAEGTLDERSVRGMRLQFQRRLNLSTYLANEERAYTMHSTDEEESTPGGTIYRRDQSDEYNRPDAFGVEFRKVVPNMPKKGHLDTSKLNAVVDLPARTTVAEALAKAGASSGLEILADARVRIRSVRFNGGKLRAGDLLDAVALAVGGTYRRVGSAYLLAADLNGTGARKLKIVLWEHELKSSVSQRQSEWMRAIAESGNASAVQYDPDSPLKPGPGLKSHLGVSPIGKPVKPPYSTEALTPELRAFMDRVNSRTQTQKIRTDIVEAHEELTYGFVLPDGNPMQSEGQLGEDWQFMPQPPREPSRPDPAIPKAKLDPAMRRPLSIRTDSTADVSQALELAKAYGFNELWIDTNRPEVLTAATAGSLPVRLVVRPWRMASLSSASDRTILGETGSAVAQRIATSAVWQSEASHWRMQTFPRWPTISIAGDVMSPFDSAWAGRLGTLLSLARTPKLAGVVVTDSMPHGYEQVGGSGQVGGYSRDLVEMWAMGFSPEARLAFIRAKGVDPIDLTTQGLHVDVDLDPMFFRDTYEGPDMAFPTQYNLHEDWTKFRNAANVRAVKSLLAGLPNLPVLVDLRPESITQPLRRFTPLVPWTPGGEFPTYTDQFPPQMPGMEAMIVAPNPREVGPLDDVANAARFLLANPKANATLDLSALPASAWAPFLGRVLERAPSSGIHAQGLK